MIDQNTLKINFLISYSCCGRLRACAAGSTHTTCICGNASITGFPLIVVGLIDVHWDQEGHFVLTPWQRTDKEILFSELALHLASAASDCMWPW